MNKDTKQYGLVLSKKAQLTAPKAGNIFGDDEESDGDDGADWVKKALQAEGERHKVKKQTRLNMEKALNEDPTIYQYDEVYEDMERVKEQNKPSIKKETKTPKYIHNLLKAAERRKMEQEHRMERLVQREREAEGEQFADKESFVTSAYREKLEQFRKIEEEEERMDRLEAIADVTKQPDMSGFHRHLFAQTFDGGKTEQVEDLNEQKNVCKDEDSSCHSSQFEDNKNNGKQCKVGVKEKSERQYRKRVMEESESESEENIQPNDEDDGDNVDDNNRGNNDNNGDADEDDDDNGENDNDDDDDDNVDEDDESDDDSNNNDDDNNVTSNGRKSGERSVKSPRKRVKLSTGKKRKEVNSNDKGTEVCKVSDNKNEKNEKIEKERVPEEVKPSIWEKRTVGPVFEAALQRYYERKALRLSGR